MRIDQRDFQPRSEEALNLHQKNSAEKFSPPRLNRIALARLGEKAAAQYLVKAGYQILDMNWRAGRFSEIDIIALDETKSLVFVEVKSRYTKARQAGFFNAGFENINWRKKQKLMTTAQMYLASNGEKFDSCRFDAIAVYFSEDFQDVSKIQKIGKASPEIRHVKNIFE